MQAISVSQASGITISGRWLSSAYTSEHMVSDSLSERHLPAYQGLSLNIGQLAGGKGEIKTYIIGHRDMLAEKSENYLKLSQQKRFSKYIYILCFNTATPMENLFIIFILFKIT